MEQAWLVIVLALVFGGALAGVQRSLGPRIAANRLRETLSVIPTIVPGADQLSTTEIMVEAADGKRRRVFQAFGEDGVRKGWVIPAAGQGFADEISLLVGLDPQADAITGLYVLDQKETPGLGASITSKDFGDQFIGMATNRVAEAVTTPPASANQIKAITGATISSQSVAQIVNATIAQLKEPLRSLNQSQNNK